MLSLALIFAHCTGDRRGPRFEARLARAYAARYIKAKAPEHVAPIAPTLDLTPRKRKILVLFVDELTNKEIAQRSILSPRTVETYVERVLGILQVGSRSRWRCDSVSLRSGPSRNDRLHGSSCQRKVRRRDECRLIGCLEGLEQ